MTTEVGHAATRTEPSRLPLDHAVPLIIAPSVSAGGEVKGATGSILRLPSGACLLTASHVLAGYERRIREGERLNWQFGKLPPFDPLPRVAWRDERRDVVLLRLTEDDVQSVGRCRIAVPSPWPPPIPAQGELLLLAGYPEKNREVDAKGWVGAGPFSALFRVATMGHDYCTCRNSSASAQEPLLGEFPVAPCSCSATGIVFSWELLPTTGTWTLRAWS